MSSKPTDGSHVQTAQILSQAEKIGEEMVWEEKQEGK